MSRVLILVHPNYEDLVLNCPKLQNYAKFLKTEINYFVDKKNPIIAIANTIKKRDELPSYFESLGINCHKIEVLENIIRGSKDNRDTTKVFEIIRDKYEINLDKLEGVIGGMYYNACVASFARGGFEEYNGPKLFSMYEEGWPTKLKGLKCQVKPEICYDLE